ncbi:hypothetical protein BDZ94DRAFT_1240904 [Collybia nuda]|uniref:Uncharacterized protein n=1 Tax=Collybia nuda TaxID=64659 RepID=A0A9P5XVE3_9AGAR|nr:hypothetical protein BDZ94DRAFT_1240904 [Collybia nuda]
MTEYDFSPEAYHRHLENMHGISRWVDQTEQNRPQFENAAALTARGGKEHRGRLGKKRSSRRPPPPPPLPLPPQHGMVHMPQYPTSPYSGSSSQGFGYSSAPNSPGPMPTLSLYQQPSQYLSPMPSYGYGVPPPYPPSGYMQGYPASPSHSHGYGSSYAFPPPQPPFGQFPGMVVGGNMVAPGYVILPQSSGRRSHRRRSMSYVYV